MSDRYMCSNCETGHEDAEDAVLCCQCEQCTELKATIKRQQAALEAIGRECENTVTLEGEQLCNADAIKALAKAEVKS